MWAHQGPFQKLSAADMCLIYCVSGNSSHENQFELCCCHLQLKEHEQGTSSLENREKLSQGHWLAKESQWLFSRVQLVCPTPVGEKLWSHL